MAEHEREEESSPPGEEPSPPGEIPPPSDFEKEFQRKFASAILELIGYKGDLRDRLSALLDPIKPQTSSILNQFQVSYVQDAHLAELLYPEFAPMRKDAEQLEFSSISRDGKGREQAIELISASSGAKALKGMLAITPSMQAERPSRIPTLKKSAKE